MIYIQDLFKKNLLVKILALIAATIMWGYVMNEENPSVNASYTVPVEIMNAPEGYDVTLENKEVTLKVRAPRALIAAVNKADFKAYIDLSNNTEGESDEQIKTAVPQGFELISLSEEKVHVKMESLIARGVPVDIAVSGKPSDDMEVGNIQPAQQYVNVYGPRHLVDSVVKVSGKIRLADNNSDFTMRVKLTAVTADGENINNLTVIPGELDVTVQLLPGIGKKIVPVKPSVTGILPEGYTLESITAQPLQVELTGPIKLLTDIKNVETKTISLHNMTATTDQEVELALPEGITAAANKVTIHIEINDKEQ